MPRKKKTKVTSSRPKAKIPEGDEGKDLSAEVKRDKLETLLSDFLDSVDQILKQIERDGKDSIREIKTFFNMELMKLPTDTRNMLLVDFLSYGGSINEVKDQQILKEVNERHMMKTGGTKLKAIVEEDSENMGPAEAAKCRPRRTRAGAGTTQPKNVRTQKPYSKKMNFGMETPLVTPKFDPRLPFTPATQARRQKPGERVMTMSLAGSPIEADKLGIPLKFKTGNVMYFDTDSDPSAIQPDQLDSEALNELQKLQQSIAKIVNRHN